DRLRLEIGDRVGLRQVRELGVLRLQRPADERREAARLALHVAYAEQVLDAISEGFAEAIHHGDRRPQAEPVRDLHHLEPAIGPRLLAGDLVAHALHEDLAAAAGNRIETSRHQLPDDLFNRHAEPAREEIDLRRREAVDVDRVVTLDVAQQIEIPLERDVGVVSALHQNLHAADRLELVDLPADFL